MVARYPHLRFTFNNNFIII